MYYRASDLKGLQQQRLGAHFKSETGRLTGDEGGTQQLEARELDEKAAKGKASRATGLFRRWRSANA